MAKGDEFPAEWRTFRDRETGASVRQLTDYKGHSHHLYFTNSGWYEGGRRLLFSSDRENRARRAEASGLAPQFLPHPADPRTPPLHRGRQKVVYTSDHTGYGNVYLVKVPDFEELPEHVHL